jgi:hypothetical protein
MKVVTTSATPAWLQILDPATDRPWMHLSRAAAADLVEVLVEEIARAERDGRGDFTLQVEFPDDRKGTWAWTVSRARSFVSETLQQLAAPPSLAERHGRPLQEIGTIKRNAKGEIERIEKDFVY